VEEIKNLVQVSNQAVKELNKLESKSSANGNGNGNVNVNVNDK
jgi:hypothetical protein